MKLKYRVGLDLGANSLGWCVYVLDAHGEPSRIVRAGVRIFPMAAIQRTWHLLLPTAALRGNPAGVAIAC